MRWMLPPDLGAALLLRRPWVCRYLRLGPCRTYLRCEAIDAGRTRPNRGIPRLGKLLKGARMQGKKKREQEGKLLIASLHLMAV